MTSVAVLSLSGGASQLVYGVVAATQTPEAAYQAWAAALGVSATETLQALDGDDEGYAITLAAPVFALGPATAMFSSEAGLGFYRNALSDQASEPYSISNVSRMHGLVSRPTLLLSFHPQDDLKSFGARLQRSGNTTILYAQFSNYNNEAAFLYHVAVKWEGGSIELIGQAVTDATTLYWTELEETDAATTEVQQAAVVTQAVGEIWHLSAWVELSSGAVSAPTPLGVPAAWGYVGIAPREAVGAVPTLLAAPRLLGQYRPIARAAVPALLGVPALQALLEPQAWGQVPSLLAAPQLVTRVQAAGLAAVPSVLGAAGVLAMHDFTGQLGDPISRYVMDLVTPEGVVRVPISSWQATLRAGGSNYVQCVVPAVLDWVDRIHAATEFVIYRSAVLASGETFEYEMARSPLEQTALDRGPTQYTGTISGYSVGFAPSEGEPAAALDRTLTGVRSVSAYSSGDMRVRCGVDWLLRPGHRAWVNDAAFVVDYINYYVMRSDAYMDVGS